MRSSRRASMVGTLAAVLLAVPTARAGAITGLTLHKCYGAGAGCTNLAGNPLQRAEAIAVSLNGSVYVTGSAVQGNATVKFDGHTGRTGARGYVSFTVVLQRRTYSASASAPGKVGATITLHPM
jgi:hypothetical protein